MDMSADIVIADDHKLFRKGIMSLLEDFDFVGKVYEAENGVELLDLLKETRPRPDVVLLDIQMPVMDGIEAHKQIRRKYPQQKVLIITMEADEQIMLHLISEGVNGYLMKNADPEELEEALKLVLKNDFYFPKEISQVLLKSVKQRQSRLKELPEFTDRELEVLNLICKEYTALEIAEKLDISSRTVEGFRRKLLEKTNSKNSAGLVVYAIKNRLVFI
jgi:DNA-binding NarL/FixJ family response regulator